MKKMSKLRVLWIISLLVLVFVLIFGYINYPIPNEIKIGQTNMKGIDIFEVLVRMPLRAIIYWSANIFNNNYILGIALATIIIKTIVAPLTITTTLNNKKTKLIKDDIQKIKDYYNKNNNEDKRKEAMDIQALQARFGINMFAGFPAMILQLVLLIIFYQAIMSTPIFKNTIAYGIDLSKPNLYFAILAALSTFLLQKWTISNSVAANEQAESMNRTFLYVMPVIIFFASNTQPASLAVYWVISNLFSLLSNILIQKFI